MTVFAASSLTDVFTELSEDFEAQYPDMNVQLQFAGSSQLAIQITQGAPADIFASANAYQMDIIREDNLLSDEALIFAKNELVLIIPQDNPAELTEFSDIFQPDVRLITAVEGVPIRTYTDSLIDNLAVNEIYTTEMYAQFYENIRSEETNVRQVVLKITLGEADAAIVYLTDITEEVEDELQILPIPQEYAPIPEYFIAKLMNGENEAVAQLFLDYIMSENGQKTLEKYGFRGATSSVASATTSPAP